MRGGLNSFRNHANAKEENITYNNSNNMYNLPQYSSLSTFRQHNNNSYPHHYNHHHQQQQQQHQQQQALPFMPIMPTNHIMNQHYVSPNHQSHVYPNNNSLNNEVHKIQVRLLEARNKNIAMKKNLLQSIQTNYMKQDNNIKEKEKMESNTKSISFASTKEEKIQEYAQPFSKKDKMEENIDMNNNNNNKVPYSRRSSTKNNLPPSILSNKNSPRRSSKFLEKPQDIDSDDSDNESPPQREPRKASVPQPTTPKNADLAIIAEQMARTISDNQALLAPSTEDESQTKQKMSKETEKKRYKAVMESRDENYDIMPLWRHRMKGRFNPPPHIVLRGKRLFRVIVWGIIIFYARPYSTMLRLRRKNRDRNRVELKKNITMLADGCNDWFGNIIRVTLSSMENDPSLDFEPTDSFTNNRNMPLKQRLLQLKIRIKAIIEAITSNELPDHFVEILVTIIDDGNYFFKEFLFEYEDKLLEFDALGGTRNMLILPRMNYNYNGKPKILYEVGIGRSQIDVKRARTIIQNFIMIKILVSHILLSPWSFGVSKKPVKNIKRVVNNHRVLATTVYEIVRLVDPDLPAIEQTALVPSVQSDDKESKNVTAPSTELPSDAPEEKLIEASDEVKVETTKKIENKNNQPENDSRLEKFIGVVLGRTKKSNSEIGADSIEERILGPRSPFCSLQEIHNRLILASEFDAAKKEINGWMQEYANKVEIWIEKSVQRVLNRRHEIIANDIGGEDNAQNMLGSLTTRRETARNDNASRYNIPKLNFNI